MAVPFRRLDRPRHGLHYGRHLTFAKQVDDLVRMRAVTHKIPAADGQIRAAGGDVTQNHLQGESLPWMSEK